MFLTRLSDGNWILFYNFVIKTDSDVLLLNVSLRPNNAVNFFMKSYFYFHVLAYLGFHKAFMKTEIHFPWKFKCDFTKTFTTIEWMKIVLSYLPQNPLRDTIGWNPFRGGAFLLTSTHLRNHSMFFLRVGHETTYTYISLEKTSKLYFGLNNTQTEIQVFMLLQN